MPSSRAWQSSIARRAPVCLPCLNYLHPWLLSFCRPPGCTGCFWFGYSRWKRGRHFMFQRKQDRLLAEKNGFPRKREASESIVLREQNRRCRTVCLGDDPELSAV